MTDNDESLKKIEEYQEKYDKDPLDFKSLFSLAFEYSKIENREMSVKCYEILINKLEKSQDKDAKTYLGSSYNNLAIEYQALNIKKSRILDLYITAYSYKKSEIITRNLAGTYKSAGKRKEAIALYAELARNYTTNIDYIHKQIQLYFELYEIKNTKKELKEDYLGKATELLKFLYNSSEFNAMFKSMYSDEAYLVSEILKLEKSNDEPKIYLYLSKIFQRINSIKKKLRMNLDENVEISHYTSLETLRILIKRNSKFRISNAIYLNDPTEGEVFEKCFDNLWNKEIISNISNNQDKNKSNKLDINNTYIASFSMKSDYLPMWVQYGDDAKGCSIVFSKSMFDKDDIPYNLNSSDEGNSESESVHTQSSDNLQSYCLYKVQYISEDSSNIDPTIKDNLIQIGKLLNGCKYDLFDDAQIIYSFTNTLLEQIRYLFKSDSYKHEEEMRIVLFSQIENALVEDFNRDDSVFPHVYVELDKELKFDKVIFGSKVLKANENVPFLIKSGKVNSVFKSMIKYK